MFACVLASLLLKQYFTNEITFLKGFVHCLKRSSHTTGHFTIVFESTLKIIYSMQSEKHQNPIMKASNFGYLKITKLHTHACIQMIF